MEEKRIFGAIVDTGVQEDAHDMTNKLYNYTEDSDAYYYELSIKSGKQPMNSGAIRRKLGNTTH